jgi:hypothetical protein
MITIDQAVADLCAVPRPVIFLDTCTLLDIIRAPLRDLTATVRAALDSEACALPEEYDSLLKTLC